MEGSGAEERAYKYEESKYLYARRKKRKDPELKSEHTNMSKASFYMPAPQFGRIWNSKMGLLSFKEGVRDMSF